ncbi:MAG: AAA family ATPase [Saprospiraceae bacterium]|nr:AAA family ATPase [Saprospiraceae bacterium]
MITKIDIDKFGLFENFKWDSLINKNKTFRRLNIIYGRNYSGKTTLSRILNSIYEKKLPNNYEGSKFQIQFSDGSLVSNETLQEEQNFDFRVYNSDFVKTNLSWLYKEDGTISPFTILGSKNIEIDQKIKEIENQLGSIEYNKGLLFKLKELEDVYNSKNLELVNKQTEIDNKLREKAKQIKTNAPIFNVPNYQINSIKNDIDDALEQGALSEEVIIELKKLLKEEEKSAFVPLREFKPDFPNQIIQVNDILKSK